MPVSRRAISLHRRLGWSTVLLALCATAVTYLYLKRAETESIDAGMRRILENRVRGVCDRLEREGEVLRSFEALLGSSPSLVEGAEFDSFAERATRNQPEVSGAFWAPCAEGKHLLYRSLPEGASGSTEAEVASEAAVKDLMEACAGKDGFVLSAPFFPRTDGARRLLALMKAVRRPSASASAGVVGLLLQPDDLLTQALSTHSTYAIRFDVLDITSPGDRVPVAEHRASAAEPPSYPLSVEERKEVFGREWSFVCRAMPTLLEEKRQRGAGIALASGLLVVTLIALYQLASGRRLREMNRLVEERTSALTRLETAMQDLQRASDLVGTQERLRALGQMASGIAHDFNNALSPVLGFTELLLSDPARVGDRERLLKDLNSIRTAAKDAASVVRRLKEFYRQREEEQQLVPVDLNGLVRETVELTRPRWRDQSLAAGLTIEVRTELGSVGSIAGDAAQLREAITNLLFNSIDAMPAGGTITVSTSCTADSVVLSVKDTGVGMSEEVRQRCLEPFYTTKGKAGSGMGLAMVYGISRRHHAELEVLSSPGAGTEVRLKLPRAGAAVQPQKSETRRVLRRTLRVLAVDDEPLVRDLVRQYLELDGHLVETAADGREGMESFRHAEFDLVITDSAMPEMSGEALAARVKGEKPDCPVILLTGFGDMVQASGRKPEHVDLVLGKPLTVQALRSAIGSLGNS